ncbi:MAG: hypothetical protein DRJ64_03610 [Thermoprotei archaeon]|nr:MAG: hypothetical protein DRJ64_03610 [Thermoprotei archaeon]
MIEIMRMELVQVVREKSYLFGLLLRSMRYVFLMYLIVRVWHIRNPLGGAYYLLASGIMLSWTVIFAFGTRTYQEKIQRTLDTIMVSPSPLLRVLIAKNLCGLICGTLFLLIFLAVARAFVDQAFILFAPWPFAFYLLSCLGIFALSLCVSLASALNWSLRSFVGSLVPLAYILSGISFPVELLPQPVHWLAWISPVYWPIQGLKLSLKESGGATIGHFGLSALSVAWYLILAVSVVDLLVRRFTRYGEWVNF